jgi:hypothetical protein
MRAAVGALERSSHPMGRTAERLSGSYRGRRPPIEGDPCPWRTTSSSHQAGTGTRARRTCAPGNWARGGPACRRRHGRANWCACCSPCTVLQTTVPPAGELSESAAEPRAARPMSEGRPMVHAARRPSSRRTAAALGAGVEPVRHTQSGTEFPKYRAYRARRRSANVTISVIGSSGDGSKPRAR